MFNKQKFPKTMAGSPNQVRGLHTLKKKQHIWRNHLRLRVIVRVPFYIINIVKMTDNENNY